MGRDFPFAEVYALMFSIFGSYTTIFKPIFPFFPQEAVCFYEPILYGNEM